MAVYQGIDPGATGTKKITISTDWRGGVSISNARPTRKILMIPSNNITFRIFTFPFQDRKRILNILPGEMMENVILPMEKMAWEVLSVRKNTASTIMTVKDELERIVSSIGEEVQVVDAEPCALARVAVHNGINTALIIDMGATRTTFCGIRDGFMDYLRVRMVGGNVLDYVLSQEPDMTPARAEEIRLTQGIGNDTVKGFIDALFNSVSITGPIDYPVIILTGGLSQMKGLKEYLEEKLESPVDYFKMPGGLSPFYDVSAFGCALYGVAGRERINLKKEEQEKGMPVGLWAVLILIPLMIFSAGLKIRETQLKTESLNIQKAMASAVRKQFPKIGMVKSPLRQVQAMLKKGQTGKTGPTISVMKVLTDISACMAGMDVSLYEMDIADDDIKMKGETDSFQTVDKLRTSLSEKFATAEILDQKSKPGGRVDFSISLNPNETAKTSATPRPEATGTGTGTDE